MESQPKNPEFRNDPENFHPCVYTGNPYIGTLANSKDPDQGLHYSQNNKRAKWP